MPPPLNRREVLIGTAAASVLSACATVPTTDPTPPIVFVHGNGDSAALWTTTLWRFESNGWPRARLHAVDIPYPLARDDDAKPQEGRNSIAENTAHLSAAVDELLMTTGARQVVLIANSRGGNAVRDYLVNRSVGVGGGGGSGSSGSGGKVSHAILGGTPNHGVYADPKRSATAEFNGAGTFLMGLNAPKGPNGDEVVGPVKWLTIRSDNNDKFAQPDGVWIGSKGTPTNVSFDGPALKGAENVVIAGIDHRETAFGAKAFDAMHRFITGKAPARAESMPEARVVLDGKVSGYGVGNTAGTAPSNLPLVGAVVEVYATDATTGERRGAAVQRKTLGADGAWGPLTLDAPSPLEFVITAPGYATTHIYRSPFVRSSSIVNLRAERLPDADKSALAVVTLTRPRGYFGLPRDAISLDGQSPPGVPPGTAGVSASKLRVTDAAGRAVVGSFNGERIVGRAWPAANNELTLLELTY